MPRTVTVDLSEFKSGPGCRVAGLTLNPEQRAKVEAACLVPDISNRRIWKVLTGWGYSIGKEAVLRHRNGECVCAR